MLTERYLLDKTNKVTALIEKIENGSEKLPERCVDCPALTHELLSSFVVDCCMLNVDYFVSDIAFSAKKKKPNWCPLLKLIKERESNHAETADDSHHNDSHSTSAVLDRGEPGNP